MRPPAVIVAPVSYGLRARGAAGLGDALLEQGLAEAIGAAETTRVEPYRVRSSRHGNAIRNAHAIRSYTRLLADSVERLHHSRFPVVLAGDCSAVLGPLLALRPHGRPGLFAMDGHQDYYTVANSPHREAADMTLALATGHSASSLVLPSGYRRLAQPEDVSAFGYRDAAEAAADGCKPLPERMTRLPLDEILRKGVAQSAELGMRMARKDTYGVWFHLDVDVLDDAIMPAVDYRQPGGLDWAQFVEAVRTVLTLEPVGMTVTIYNPELDPSRQHARSLVAALAEAFAGR